MSVSVRMTRGCVIVVCGVALACGGSSSPSSPSSSASKLAAPTVQAPADGAAVGSFRPSLIVRNAPADQSASRLYEFQIADTSNFQTTAHVISTFAVVAHTTKVPEGNSGTTTFAPDFDLQSTTRFYWRARLVESATASDWTPTSTFTTPVAGYSRPGELYDPLVVGTTVGVPVGATTFIAGKGVRLEDGNAYVRYQLAQPLDSGEFSMEIEGLSPGGPGAKLKVFSMMDGTGDLYRSSYLLNAQYRGVNGNPDNCVAFKALFGDPFFKLEPDFGQRAAGIIPFDPSRGYFWKGTWSDGFRLTVQDGINGRTLYDVRIGVADLGTTLTATYNPTPHFAYLGANNGPYGEEDGSWPGATYRNVWIGRGPRPQSLGSALVRR